MTTKDGKLHTVIGYKGNTNGKTDGHLYVLQSLEDGKGETHEKFGHNIKEPTYMQVEAYEDKIKVENYDKMIAKEKLQAKNTPKKEEIKRHPK